MVATYSALLMRWTSSIDSRPAGSCPRSTALSTRRYPSCPPMVAAQSRGLHSLQCRVHSLVCSVLERIDSSTVQADPDTRLESACPVSVHPREQCAPDIARRHGIEVPGAPARTGALEPPASLA